MVFHSRHLFVGFFCLLFFAAGAQTGDELVALFKASVKDRDYAKASMLGYELGKSLNTQGKTDEAKKYLKESAGYASKSGLRAQELAATNLLATLNYKSGNYSQAAELFPHVSTLATELNSPELAIEAFVLQGKSFGELKRNKKSIEAFNKALSLSVKNNLREEQLQCYQLLSEYHLRSGDKEKAAEFSKLRTSLMKLQDDERQATAQLTHLKEEIENEKDISRDRERKLEHVQRILSRNADSLESANRNLHVVEESLKELEVINEQRQLEIELLSKDKELSTLRIEEQNAKLENEALFRNFILAVIGLGATLALVVFFNSRKTNAINKKLDLQNKNIKSSINYAKRIQEAMLPKTTFEEKAWKESFIVFKPRDMVSGDFYWFAKTSGDLAFAAIDCTGHGVPGAFMSMIGINSLNSIINKGVGDTNLILDNLHREIRSSLQQDVSGNNDGMDAALCIYRPKRRVLEFSGAKNPLVYIQNGELFQIKGDIHPIGGTRNKDELKFRKHEITLDSETMVYLFTDGFRDQFGGPENQKFLSKRFTKLLLDIHTLPLEEQKQRLEAAFEEWRGKNVQTDDVLIMGVKLCPNQD